MSWTKGDVVLVSFPFTNLAGSKPRPAVVISCADYSAQTPDTMIASITSNLAAIPHPGDWQIADWQGAGLLKPSLGQMKFQTVASAIIRRKLGELGPADRAALDAGLRRALDL